jgi:Na+-translocating ferredoxin:NAD+ oxidoreductase RnfD subunit
MKTALSLGAFLVLSLLLGVVLPSLLSWLCDEVHNLSHN